MLCAAHRGEAGALAGRVGQLLLVEDAKAEDDHAEERQRKDREYEGELRQGLPELASLEAAPSTRGRPLDPGNTPL